MTNVLYTLFDMAVWFGRVIGFILISLAALLLFGFLVIQVLAVIGIGVGGVTASLMFDTAPEFLKDFLSSKVVTGG